MLRSLPLLTLALAFGCVTRVTTVSRSPGPHAKPSLVAVLPFQGEYSLGLQHDPEGGAQATEGCRAALVAAGITIVPRAHVDAEIAWGRVHPFEDESARAMAQRLGADFVILGASTSGKFELAVDVRVLRVDGVVDATGHGNEGDDMAEIGNHVCAAIFR